MAALVLLPGAASAATITPNITADELDPTNTNCSLREAVEIANDNTTTGNETDCAVTGPALTPGGADTVVLGAGTPYAVDLPGLDDTNAGGDIDANAVSAEALTIDGAGAGATTIDSNGADRVLHNVVMGSSSLTITDLTVTGGSTGSGVPGGGILSDSNLAVERVRVTMNSTTDAMGGGIAAFGSVLSISDSFITANTTTAGGVGGGVGSVAATTSIDSSRISGNNAALSSGTPIRGGGVYADGTLLTVTDSEIADNKVTNTGAGGALGGGLSITSPMLLSEIRGTTISENEVIADGGQAGGLAIDGMGSLTLINSTVSANEALSAGASAGGATVAGGTLDVVHTTFGPNPSTGAPTALRNVGDPIDVRGSVIETSGGLAACGTISSGDDNVFTDMSCGAPMGNDLTDADPMLGVLMDNGGPDAGAPGFLSPIVTHLPAAASVVVDHVPVTDCDDEPTGTLMVDQRGFMRPLDGDDGDTVAECEAGSVEIPATPPAPPPAGSTPPPAAAQPAQATPKKCRKGRKLKKGKCVKKRKKKK